MLRIYGKNRHLSTIPNDVRKYVIMRESAKGVLSPELPSVEDIQYTDIVITTVHTCLELIKLKMKGSFTHIFIDEAGQTFEPELLIPLSLATRNTCVVLAGDVMQMSPQVYSPDAQSLKTSLLQRIFEGYEIESQSQGKTAEPKHSVSLRENYRNEQIILKFLSKVVYGDEEKLIWKSGIKTVEPSLRFHAVQGKEKPGAGMSYYNEEEVIEIERILYNFNKHWPSEWGPKNLSRIVVTSMYHDQVGIIFYLK